MNVVVLYSLMIHFSIYQMDTILATKMYMDTSLINL